MRKDYDKEFIEIDTAPLSIGNILKMAQHNIGNTTYTDALLLYAYNCNPTDHYIIGFVARIIKQRRFNEVSLPGEPHELMRPQQIDQDPRAKYRRLDMVARTELIKSALFGLYNRKLFTTKNHWIGTFLVVRDRLEKAGFTPWFVNEIEPVFCSTYKYNHKLSDKHYYIGDIRELNTRIREYDKLLKDIDIVIGGPPCQGFSMANRQRIIDDPRNELYKAYLTFLSHVRPLFFVMENVRGMRKRQQEIYEDIVSYLGNDYQFKSIILQASDFGIPQNRERFIIIGNRLGVKINDIFLKLSEYSRMSIPQ